MSGPKPAGGQVSSEAVSVGGRAVDRSWCCSAMYHILSVEAGRSERKNTSASLCSCRPVAALHPLPPFCSLVLLSSSLLPPSPLSPPFCFSLPFSFPSILLSFYPSFPPFLFQNPPGLETSLNKTRLPLQGIYCSVRLLGSLFH